jgi:glycosyltransferase involved in cell wall biosynthesis
MDKITIANFYPVHPFVHGGQRRIFFLARELAREFSVTLVTLGRGRQVKYIELDQGLTEIQVPAGERYLDLEREILGYSYTLSDVAYAVHWTQCRLYQGVLREQLRTSRLAISEHPYSYYAIKAARGRHRPVPILYNSQNVEVIQKEALLVGREDLMAVVRSIERAAVSESAAVVACSEVDRAGFVSEYSVPADKITIVENGVDSSAVPSISPQDRHAFRRQLGLGNRFTAIFGGSIHFPNLAAVDCILAIAAQLHEIVFVIAGTVCGCPALQGRLPPNVLVLGSIPEVEKWLAFVVSDVALNPMSLGSGSNIKMFEYAAAALPTLSTPFGARGTGMRPRVHYYEARLEDFASRLSEIAHLDRQVVSQVGSVARDYVRETSDWRVIGKRYRALLSALLVDEHAHRDIADVLAC